MIHAQARQEQHRSGRCIEFPSHRVQRFTPLLIDAARPCRHATGDRWFVDETHVKVAGRWLHLYRAIDQFGQVIDVLVLEKRDLAATRRFFTRALDHGPHPAEVTTDRALAYPRVLDELLPAACHVMDRYSNNSIETDHGQLKSRLRSMRGLKPLRSARLISAGHAFIQNLHRSHYELGVDLDPRHRLPAAFTELALAIRPGIPDREILPALHQRNSALLTSRSVTPVSAWRASQIPDKRTYRVRSGMKGDKCQSGAEGTRLNSRTKRRRW
jgi:transposase, IS6 family